MTWVAKDAIHSVVLCGPEPLYWLLTSLWLADIAISSSPHPFSFHNCMYFSFSLFFSSVNVSILILESFLASEGVSMSGQNCAPWGAAYH